jgi:hypothetical protein
MEAPTQTEFNSNKATLERVDSLIKGCHSAAIANNGPTYLAMLARLWVELDNKATVNERQEAKAHQDAISSKKKAFSAHLIRPRRTLSSAAENNTKFRNYSRAWSFILNYAEEYEIFIMRTLERHGMLLRNEASVEDAL